MMRRLMALCAAASIAAAAPAYPQASAGDALRTSDPAGAVRLWTGEALAGSMHAALELGLAHDLGLGVPEDKVTAMLWYLKAARAGHPDAQFNVAVMLDSGLALPAPDVEKASVWYTRAAMNGHPRAQYNLGLLYEAGEGVIRNADLARYWFAKAAESLPAARKKRDAMPAESGARSLAAPIVLGAARVDIDGWHLAELVWTAAPGPAGVPFTVELVVPDRRDGWSVPVLTEATEASGIVLDLQGLGDAFAWRVLRVDPETGAEASSDWHRLGPSSRPLPRQDRDAAKSGAVPAAEILGSRIREAMSQ